MELKLPDNILGLRQRRVEAKNLMNKAKAEGRELTSEEARYVDSVIAALRAKERELEEEKHMPGITIPQGLAPWEPGAQWWREKQPKTLGRTGPKYVEMFGGHLSGDGFQTFDQFLKAWHTAPLQFDPRLRASQGEGVPSAGGFMVPDEWAAQVLDTALESEIVRPRAQVWPMAGEIRKTPGFDGFSHASNLYGGFSATWVNEASTLTPSDAKVRLVTLTANKLALVGQASNELIADALGGSGFEAVYGAAMTAAASWFLDLYFLTGSGSSQPLGILNDPALIVVSKESSQAANTIRYENVVKMFARMHPASIPRSVWVCNSTTIPQLLAMQNRVFNLAGSDVVGGSAVPVVSQQGDQMTLLTRPILFTEKLPALSSQGDIVLVDLTQYAVGIRKDLMLEKSGHAGFTSDTTYFRLVVRVDGQGTWKSALTPKNGDSLSWVVTLQAR